MISGTFKKTMPSSISSRTVRAHFRSAIFLMVFSLLIVFFTGCASLSPLRSTVIPQVITVDEKITVYLYDSLTPLNEAYVKWGGEIDDNSRVKGFYLKTDNSLHCLNWDFYTCGHELFHVLQYKGNTPLIIADDRYEHFEGNNFASE